MNFLTLTEAKLPPGFRFHPRDDELVCDYLGRKICKDQSNEVPAMVEVDLNKCEPWDLPDSAKVGKEWYFFSQRDRKYSTGLRTNRATISGYWKATGKDRQIHDVKTGQLVGARKTLVFYTGRAPKGRKSDWVMHEFRVEGWPSSPPPALPFKVPKDQIDPSFSEDWVLCRVFHKNRGTSTRSNKDDSFEEPSSCSLPPLVDHPFHDSLNLKDYEHGPCFSNIPQNHTPHFGELTDMGVGLIKSYEESFSSDSHVLKSALDQLARSELSIKPEVPPMMGSESFSRSSQSLYSHENYLSDVGLPHFWNTFESQ